MEGELKTLESGTEIDAPVWALRCIGKCKSVGGSAADRDPGNDDRRVLSAALELFEQLYTGRATPMSLTDKRPLDVFVHRGKDGRWGLYCCNRQRLLALLLWQVCMRGEFHYARCIVRPTDDGGYWNWQWNAIYEETIEQDGLCALRVLPPGSSTPSPRSSPA